LKNSGTAANEAVPSSELRASSKRQGQRVIAACAAAADELEKTRTLVDALERENKAIKERLETEKQTAAIMQELIETRRQQSDALRAALSSKNEAIAAKDAVIDSQAKLIEELKKKRASPWRRIGDMLAGAAVFAILK